MNLTQIDQILTRAIGDMAHQELHTLEEGNVIQLPKIPKAELDELEGLLMKKARAETTQPSKREKTAPEGPLPRQATSDKPKTVKRAQKPTRRSSLNKGETVMVHQGGKRKDWYIERTTAGTYVAVGGAKMVRAKTLEKALQWLESRADNSNIQRKIQKAFDLDGIKAGNTPPETTTEPIPRERKRRKDAAYTVNDILKTLENPATRTLTPQELRIAFGGKTATHKAFLEKLADQGKVVRTTDRTLQAYALPPKQETEKKTKSSVVKSLNELIFQAESLSRGLGTYTSALVTIGRSDSASNLLMFLQGPSIDQVDKAASTLRNNTHSFYNTMRNPALLPTRPTSLVKIGPMDEKSLLKEISEYLQQKKTFITGELDDFLNEWDRRYLTNSILRRNSGFDQQIKNIVEKQLLPVISDIQKQTQKAKTKAQKTTKTTPATQAKISPRHKAMFDALTGLIHEVETLADHYGDIAMALEYKGSGDGAEVKEFHRQITIEGGERSYAEMSAKNMRNKASEIETALNKVIPPHTKKSISINGRTDSDLFLSIQQYATQKRKAFIAANKKIDDAFRGALSDQEAHWWKVARYFDEKADNLENYMKSMARNMRRYRKQLAGKKALAEPETVSTQPSPGKVTPKMVAKFAAQIQHAVNRASSDFLGKSDKISVIKRRKYYAVDAGSSGWLLVDQEGKVWGIKAYGVKHPGYYHGNVQDFIRNGGKLYRYRDLLKLKPYMSAMAKELV